MSCSQGASKLSDVLEILSDETDKMYTCASVSGVYNERDKQVFTDAVHYCMVLLRQSKRFTDRRSEVLSLEATLMGHEMFERIIGINVQMDVETEDEIFVQSEISETPEVARDAVKQEPKEDYEETVACNELDLRTTVKQETADATPVASPDESAANEMNNSMGISARRTPPKSRPMVVEIPRETMQYFLRNSKSLSPGLTAGAIDDKQFPPSPAASLSGSDCSSEKSYKRDQKPGSTRAPQKVIPLDLKRKAVNMARLNPQWSLAKLRREAGIPALASIHQLKAWAKTVDCGGSRYDKQNTINALTFERFLEARAKKVPVSIDMIHNWARQMAREVYGAKFGFKTTKHWETNFKKIYRLQYNGANGYDQKKEKKSGV